MSSYTVEGLNVTISLDDEFIAVADSFIVITSANFTGSNYQNDDLIGLTAQTGFNVWSNDGSGTLLKVNDGYTFNSGTGTITMTAGNYLILIL